MKLDDKIFGPPEAYENLRKKVHTIKQTPECPEIQSLCEERAKFSNLITTENDMECRPGEYVLLILLFYEIILK